ncbi:phage tail terminator protein [Listeria booriae]|uniref:phage tail terminator protein n=1 Tax=Listeria booriae TaxID=1552123 RepID=UPI0016241B16|nr:minor capsid protein [Listeria booriae]MBC1982777.1 minor capsid protein [Listeria booriae]
MSLDFQDMLMNEVDTLKLAYPIRAGALDVEDSIALNSIAGGKTIKSYYDGTEQKALNYEFSIKTKDQKKAIDSLNAISLHLEATRRLPSGNSSYDFDGIKTTNESFFVGEDEKGFFFFRLIIQATITVY